ncbi:MAG: flagellar basal body L-ring protein FlgH [Desulfobacteraceae bacterium]|nr:flagellar basal body L-ring protein FlgH [Desulfobacteraceae bacterium]
MFGKRGWLTRFLIFGASFSLLAMNLLGCAAGQKETMRDTNLNRAMSLGVNYDHRLKPRKYEGSLWKNNGTLSSLFQDYKASRVGDVVTVILDQKLTGSTNANTDTSRDSSLKAGMNSSFTGFGKKVSAYKAGVDTSLGTSHKGKGKTDRSGALTGTITARVVKVLSDGNLVIAGSREIMVNDETNFLSLSGIIQPRDIRYKRDKNGIWGYEIESSRISDAKFVYSGRGVVAQRQRPGWFSSFVNVIWPF